MIWDCIASDALRLMIGLENSRYPLGPSDPTGAWQDGKRVDCKYLPLSHTKP